jgi:hypothetical protein
MDPLNDVNGLCPCWIILDDGTRHRCDVPRSLRGNFPELQYDFVSEGESKTVRWSTIKAFESIADPSRRIDRK